MKKIFAFVMAVALLASCGNRQAAQSNEVEAAADSVEVAVDTAAVETLVAE